jgi:hypothetical protein
MSKSSESVFCKGLTQSYLIALGFHTLSERLHCLVATAGIKVSNKV